ncbi:WD40 domain-containing protein [Zalerion maritima]|uniref:WD40 domain-containing protein n=1 Tax=Zalerion maritima TaxID=339359 RepID=A0AAD5RI50_9PEZI|nr:WD40 domain-containing protein [Zalerion maritima]
MFFSRKFPSSCHSTASPNGQLVATLFPQAVTVRSVESMEVVSTIKLPSDLSGNVCSFLWSPTSDKLLVAAPDEIHVFPALRKSFRAVIRNPMNVTSRHLFVQFGPTGTDVLACPPFGLKFVIFDLNSSRCFEIGNPKFFGPLSASKGFSFRPRTAHLALLTRAQGKDLVSLHHPVSRELLRSWHPDTMDASQLSWTTDGRWLVVCESPAHGHKLLFYTSDGHLFKTWTGPSDPPVTDKDYALGAGIRVVECSRDGESIAVGDHSRCICVLNGGAVTEGIWQEQLTIPQTGCSVHAFVKASLAVSPPPWAVEASKPPPNNGAINARNASGATGDDLRSGASLIAFDASTTLLASRIEEAPTTVWIWDLKAAELRAVLMFHGHVTSLSWHPSIRELLAIRCDGDSYGGILFVWDPLWQGPRAVNFVDRLAEQRVVGRSRWSWLDVQADSAALFFADSKEAMFASIAESDEELLPWESHEQGQQQQHEREANSFSGSSGHREESPLELIPAEDVQGEGYNLVTDEEEEVAVVDITELDDTFRFKKFVSPRDT